MLRLRFLVIANLILSSMTLYSTPSPQIFIGWGEADITPQAPVALAGQFGARLSESVADPLKAAVAAFSSGDTGFVFVGCDLICISDDLKQAVHDELRRRLPEFPADAVILHATHTHTAPEIRRPNGVRSHIGSRGNGLDLGELPPDQYLADASRKIAVAIESAWKSRSPGAIAYGMDEAVIARNRRWVDHRGVSTMYRLKDEAIEHFRHIEGYEDHTLNLLATYTAQGELSGLIVNLPSPAQSTGTAYFVSADFWHETREELRRRMGRHIPILPQCSAAGDLTDTLIWGESAHRRMRELRGRTQRQEVAIRIADAVERILPAIHATRESAPAVAVRSITVALPVNPLSEEDAAQARKEADEAGRQFEEAVAELEAHPDLRKHPRWYNAATRAWRSQSWHLGVEARYHLQQQGVRTAPAEIHVIRMGDIAFASNPVELYVDFGIQLKVRSPFLQTFLIQLAGEGSYIPSPRSVAGGGYGSVPASNPIGPEGGQQLVEETLRLLRELKATGTP